MICVSVVVPVYNPGRFLSACVDSLTSQTMPTDSYEVIFVDDGSTDETPAYLDDVAARYDYVTVIHQENSGWPGKPRNVGIDAARGEYVFFCDHDDWLGSEALERMYAYACENSSDVLLGKMAGLNRSVPQNIFRHSRPAATLDDAPLMDSLTPHKLFRRALLLEHSIRFPEGRRRLEDHVFVVAAYLLAERISVYAEYTCYYHIRRDDSSNAGFSAIDWAGYFVNLSEALDVVVAHTEPGNFRDGIYRRWLQVEMVNRLSGRPLIDSDPGEAKQLFASASAIAARYFGEGVVLKLPAASRGVARALIRNDLRAARRLAVANVGWRLQSKLLQAGWLNGVLQISGIAAFADTATGAADPGRSELFEGLTDQEYAEGISKSTLVLDLTERRTGQRWSWTPTLTRHGLVTAFSADLDATRLAAGGRLPDGIWDLYAESSLLGLRRRHRLTLSPDRMPEGVLLPPAGSGAELGQPPSRPVAAYLTQGNYGLSLDLGLLYHPELRRPAAGKTG